MPRTLNRYFLAAALVTGLSLAACKQEAGEYCEVDSDCTTGMCVSAANGNGVCSTSGVEVFDAAPPVDARPAGDGAAPASPEAAAPGPEAAVPGPEVSPPPPDVAPATPDLGPDATPDTITTAGDATASG